MAVFNWNFTKFKLWAVLYYPTVYENGVVSFLPVGIDVSAAEISFGLNEIPTCNLKLAIGREATTGTVASFHHIIGSLRSGVPIQVWLEAIEFSTSVGRPLVSWPAGPFVIFEGLLTNQGFQKQSSFQAGGAGFVVTVQHWLGALNFSSALSQSSHVTNPAHYYNPAGLILGAGAQQLGATALVSSAMGAGAFSPTILETDMWAGINAEQGILGFLRKLTEQDMLAVQELGIQPGQRTNSEARGALSRFEPLFEDEYNFGVPLKLRLDDAANAGAISRAITEDISNETFDASSSVTMWDKLTYEFSGSFLFSVVPMIDRALVVPFIPGLRSFWQTVYAEDYDTITINDATSRPLRGMGLFTGIASGAGAFAPVNMAPPSLGGYYENPDFPTGVIQFKSGPPWLSRVMANSLTGVQSANPFGPGGSAMFPGSGPAPTMSSVEVEQARAKNMLDGFARVMYINEILQTRTCTVTGRPRFDIAPGSTVQVILSEEKFVANSLGFLASVAPVYGSVIRLTTTFDAESNHAGTSMMISHVRNELENQLDSTSIADHPLWTYPWAGAPLLPFAEFIPADNGVFGEEQEVEEAL